MNYQTLYNRLKTYKEVEYRYQKVISICNEIARNYEDELRDNTDDYNMHFRIIKRLNEIHKRSILLKENIRIEIKHIEHKISNDYNK
jgi:hypothetical protein